MTAGAPPVHAAMLLICVRQARLRWPGRRCSRVRTIDPTCRREGSGHRKRDDPTIRPAVFDFGVRSMCHRKLLATQGPPEASWVVLLLAAGGDVWLFFGGVPGCETMPPCKYLLVLGYAEYRHVLRVALLLLSRARGVLNWGRAFSVP